MKKKTTLGWGGDRDADANANKLRNKRGRVGVMLDSDRF